MLKANQAPVAVPPLNRCEGVDVMKLGVYSIVLPDYRREEAAAKVAEIGYTGIEWTVGYEDRVFNSGEQWHVSLDHLEEDAPRAKEVAQRYGLDIPSLGTSAETGDFEKIERLMKGAVAMGAPMLRIGSARYDGTTPYDELRAMVIDNYRTIETMAARHGVKALIEIHSHTICPSASATMRVLENFDPRHVGAILDPGNMVIEGMERSEEVIAGLTGKSRASRVVSSRAVFRGQVRPAFSARFK